MRNALDPLAFYKRPDRSVLPKYYQVGEWEWENEDRQIGRVVDSHEDYFNRVTKKNRKKTIFEETMADEKSMRRITNKYKGIEEKKNKQIRKKKKTNSGRKKI